MQKNKSEMQGNYRIASQLQEVARQRGRAVGPANYCFENDPFAVVTLKLTAGDRDTRSGITIVPIGTESLDKVLVRSPFTTESELTAAVEQQRISPILAAIATSLIMSGLSVGVVIPETKRQTDQQLRDINKMGW
jgi:hypothetical protein